MFEDALSARLHTLETTVPDGYWPKRAFEELSYLLELQHHGFLRQEPLLSEGIAILERANAQFQGIPAQAVQEMEDALSALYSQAKKLRIMVCANSHIDMNWMWGYQETAALTVDTIRTILALMEEYPTMTYTQSQASVYEILRTYAPDTIPQIRELVHQGRWEVAVSTWVENEKNMVCLESMARHLLYARKYVAELLDISIEDLNVDFEPDTFGHPHNLPEILSNGGIRYYYHCRGHQGANLFRWRAPSGASVLAFREPAWYNLSVDYGMYRHIPQFCGQYGVDTVLSIFGVGDHGGGPTRRDLEKLLDMASWPLFPTVEFGTVKKFFQHIESQADHLPVIDDELNYVFTGCYTSQGRVKRANRVGEEKLGQTEALQVLAAAQNPDFTPIPGLQEAWQKVLFNQFHDILPGSETLDSKEYAMGQFQSAMAYAQTGSTQAIRALAAYAAGGAEKIPLPGVGSLTGEPDSYNLSQAGLSPDHRWFLLVNTAAFPRKEQVALTMWDYPHEMDTVCVLDHCGNQVPHQVLGSGTLYWGHRYCRLLITAELPAFGYSTYQVAYAAPRQVYVPVNQEPREDTYGNGPLVLENRHIRAEFCSMTMECVSLKDKSTGVELVDGQKGVGSFWLDQENPCHAMTAWRVGPRAKTENLNRTQAVMVRDIRLDSHALRQSISYTISFARSRLEATVSLKKDAKQLDYDLQIHWLELGSPAGIPLLRFAAACGYDVQTYRYLAPGSVVDRPGVAHDVPAQGIACGINPNGPSLAVLCDCKYGFSGDGGQLGVSLLRSPFDPDPYPDQGIHYMKVSLAVTSGSRDDLEAIRVRDMHPIQSGVLPLAEGQAPAYPVWNLLRAEGCHVESVKFTEDKAGILLRLTNVSDAPASPCVTVQAKNAWLTDIAERSRRPVTIEAGSITWEMAPRSVGCLILEW